MSQRFGWGHININVSDLDASVGFYEKLGFEVFIPGIPYLNLSIDHKRKTGKWAGKTMPLVRQDDDGEETTFDLADDGEAADDGLQRQEQAATVQDAVANLPERQRTAITLCYFQELSNREAAEIMEINIKALESLLSRGRRGLQQSLGQLKSEV